tara:strand:+ start:467 stop:718 length:252 start_codon:yes stop_codon:yes gene_type:complete
MNKLFKDLMNETQLKYSIPIILVILGYFLFLYKSNGEKREDKIIIALKHAIIAYIIAICAKYDLIILPPLLVFIFSYYFHEWA